MSSLMSERLSVSFLGCSVIPNEIVYLAQKIRHDEENPNQLWQSIQNGDIAKFKLEKLNGKSSTKQLDQAQFLFLVKNISITTYNKVVKEYSKFVELSDYLERAADLGRLRFVVPPAVLSNHKVKTKWQHLHKEIIKFFHLCTDQGLSIAQSGLSLPMVSLPQDLLAFDFQTLQHFLDNAMCEQSTWEIKTLAWELYEVMKSEFRILSQRLGIKCWENRQIVCNESLSAYNQCRFGKGIRPHNSSLNSILQASHNYEAIHIRPNH